jgi:uncharacterized Zn finger protein
MGSYTQKMICNKCGSDDCNHTVTTGEIASLQLTATETYCNSCGHYTRKLVVGGREVINEE